MKIEGKPVWNWVLINALVLVFGGILFWSAYGAVAGFFVAGPLAKSDEYVKLLREVLTEEQWKALGEGRISEDQALQIVERQDKEGKLRSMHEKQLKKVNWRVVNPSVSAIVFGILGFALGVMRVFKYVALIPIILLWVTYPVLTTAHLSDGPYAQLNVCFTVFVQFVSIYLFAWLGMSLRQVLSQRRSQPTQA